MPEDRDVDPRVAEDLIVRGGASLRRSEPDHGAAIEAAVSWLLAVVRELREARARG